jgi:hypothetical protein
VGSEVGEPAASPLVAQLMTIDRTKVPRRAFLASAGRAAKALAATSLVRATAGIFASGAAVSPVRIRAETGTLLVQPPEIRSQNGVLDVMLTALRVQFGLASLRSPAFFTTTLTCRLYSERALATS